MFLLQVSSFEKSKSHQNLKCLIECNWKDVINKKNDGDMDKISYHGLFLWRNFEKAVMRLLDMNLEKPGIGSRNFALLTGVTMWAIVMDFVISEIVKNLVTIQDVALKLFNSVFNEQ